MSVGKNNNNRKQLLIWTDMLWPAQCVGFCDWIVILDQGLTLNYGHLLKRKKEKNETFPFIWMFVGKNINKKQLLIRADMLWPAQFVGFCFPISDCLFELRTVTTKAYFFFA